MLAELRRRVVEALPRGSIGWRVSRAAYLPLSVLIGTGFRLFSRRFSKPGIVIGGAGRSGTTLMLSILSAHPHIHAIDHETYALSPHQAKGPPFSPAGFQLYRLFTPLATGSVPASCTRWLEKTPRNVRFFGPILEYFDDDVRILHVVRDGRDVVTSQHPHKPGEYYYSPEKWVRGVRAGLELADDPRVMTVRYEDLVGDFRPTIERICEFLDEPCVEQVLSWHEHATVRKHTAWEGDVKPLHAGSMRRWERQEFRDRVEELMSDPEAVDLLRELGYPVESV